VSPRAQSPTSAARLAVVAIVAGIVVAGLWLGYERLVSRRARQDGEAGPDDHAERRLDEAIEETFPASDPIAVSIE
jgi:hypothetical protein